MHFSRVSGSCKRFSGHFLCFQGFDSKFTKLLMMFGVFILVLCGMIWMGFSGNL